MHDVVAHIHGAEESVEAVFDVGGFGGQTRADGGREDRVSFGNNFEPRENKWKKNS